MTRRSLILLAASGSLALLLGAFAFQLAGYPPCPLCIWQRWPHAAAIAAGLVGAVWPAAIVAAIGAAAAATTSAVGLYHTGIERDWWAGPTSCTGGGGLGDLSGADLLSTAGNTRVVMCDEVSWALWGISMASWNAILSALLVVVWLAALRRR